MISISLQQEAWLVALKLLCRMISGPFLGALCDYHGRTLALTLDEDPPIWRGGKPSQPVWFFGTQILLYINLNLTYLGMMNKDGIWD